LSAEGKTVMATVDNGRTDAQIAESVLVAHGSQARQSGAHIDHFCALAGITRRRPDQFGGGEL
jgi:hypothetical protein